MINDSFLNEYNSDMISCSFSSYKVNHFLKDLSNFRYVNIFFTFLQLVEPNKSKTHLCWAVKGGYSCCYESHKQVVLFVASTNPFLPS